MAFSVVIGGYHGLSINDTDGIAFSIFFQGCKKRCPGCHNPELQPFEGGQRTDTDYVLTLIKAHEDWYDAVAFIGGEPLEQPEALIELLKGVRELGLETWLYTGYDINEVPEEVINLCSVIVAGEYREDLATGRFPASSNQVVLDRRVTNAV